MVHQRGFLKESFFCEEHVPRGCSCNYIGIEDVDLKSVYKTMTGEILKGIDLKNFVKINEDNESETDSVLLSELDDNGLEDVCCEYSYNENGWKY
jgi:hypothetical protein